MTTQPLDYVEPERPARKISVLPPVAFGFIFVPIIWIASTIDLENNPDVIFGMYTTIAQLVGTVFWFVCIHRFHTILNEISDGSYEIKPGSAVGLHFLPIYNFYWLFKWPSEFAKFIHTNSSVKMIPGGLLGFTLLASTMVKFFDGGVSLAMILGLGVYLRRKLKRYLEETGYLAFREPVEKGKRKGPWKILFLVLGSIVGLLVVLIIVVGIMMESGRMPDAFAVAAEDLHPRQLQQLREMGVVTEDERVQFFYSGAFFSIRGNGSLFTDKRVVTYMESDGEMIIMDATYDEITSIDLFPRLAGLDESTIAVTLADDSKFQLVVGTGENGHERFHRSLVRIWEKNH